LKLYIYGYLNRVRSSRRLEMGSHRNIEVIWLLRSLKPDFKTIADFRRDNRAAFRSVFRQFVLLCRRLCVQISWTEDEGKPCLAGFGPSQSAYRGRLQTTVCGWATMGLVVNDYGKVGN